MVGIWVASVVGALCVGYVVGDRNRDPQAKGSQTSKPAITTGESQGTEQSPTNGDGAFPVTLSEAAPTLEMLTGGQSLDQWVEKLIEMEDETFRLDTLGTWVVFQKWR